MKSKYMVVCFFTIIVLLVPCTSAFEMPLSDDDKSELSELINNEIVNNKEILNDIIVYNETTFNLYLDLDEVESIYEEYILTGDDQVINSDSWDWVVNRLGWFYITIEHVITLYYSGVALYNQFITGAEAVQYFFNSIQDFKVAWQAFKANPLNFLKIKILISSTVTLLMATIGLLEYATSNSLKVAIIAFADDVQVFRDFLDSNPWLQPITIKGNITGFDNSVTISVKSDSVTSNRYYELNYTTDDTVVPWFVHKCKITATYQNKTNIKNKYAFSMGVIEEDYILSDFDIKSKKMQTPIFIKLVDLFNQWFNARFNIFDDIIKMLVS